MSQETTRQPSCAKRRAVAFPMPEAAPVTIMTLLSKPVSITVPYFDWSIAQFFRFSKRSHWDSFPQSSQPVAARSSRSLLWSPAPLSRGVPAVEELIAFALLTPPAQIVQRLHLPPVLVPQTGQARARLPATVAPPCFSAIIMIDLEWQRKQRLRHPAVLTAAPGPLSQGMSQLAVDYQARTGSIFKSCRALDCMVPRSMPMCRRLSNQNTY